MNVTNRSFLLNSDISDFLLSYNGDELTFDSWHSESDIPRKNQTWKSKSE